MDEFVEMAVPGAGMVRARVPELEQEEQDRPDNETQPANVDPVVESIVCTLLNSEEPVRVGNLNSYLMQISQKLSRGFISEDDLYTTAEALELISDHLLVTGEEQIRKPKKLYGQETGY